MSFNSSLLADLTALFNDNTSGDISAADGRTVIEALLELAGPLDHKPGSADTPDDDFNTGTLDGQWTVVTGTEAAVVLLETGNVARYDVDSRIGWLLTQAGRNGSQTVQLRQDFTLPDNASMVVKVAPGFGFDGTYNDDENTVGIAVNSDDSAWFAGTNAQKLILYASTVASVESGFEVVAFDGTTSRRLFGSIGAHSLIFRIARAGNVYYPMFSTTNGESWIHLGAGFDLAGAKDNFWIVHRNDAAHTSIDPIAAWDWVRQGSNSVDPW